MSSQLYYKQISAKDEAMNSIKFGLMSYVMHAGAEVTHIGEMRGALTKVTTYFLSDGSAFSFVAHERNVPILNRLDLW